MAAPGHFRQQSWRRQGARLVPGATPPGAEPLVDKWGQPIEEGEIGIMSDDFYAEAGIPDGVEGKAGERVGGSGRFRLTVAGQKGAACQQRGGQNEAERSSNAFHCHGPHGLTGS